MSFKTDMHLHTYYSDGLLSPAEIVKRAKKLEYDIIAITDHDGTDGVREAQIAAEAIEGIKVVTGIELSTEDAEGIIDEASGEQIRHIEIHMLGYGFDIDNAALKEELEAIKQRRRDRNAGLIAILNRMGYALTEADLTAENGHGYIGKPVFARALMHKGYIGSVKEAFEDGRFLESPDAKAVKKQKIDVLYAIKLINDAGGIAVFAHPVKVKGIGTRGSEEFFANLETLIAKLKKNGLRGLECYHTDHTPEEALRLVSLAEKYHLHITEGSDYHGDADAGKTEKKQQVSSK